MIGESQLLLILANLARVQGFNNILKKRDERRASPIIQDKIKFEVLGLFRCTYLVVWMDLYKEAQWEISRCNACPLQPTLRLPSILHLTVGHCDSYPSIYGAAAPCWI